MSDDGTKRKSLLFVLASSIVTDRQACFAGSHGPLNARRRNPRLSCDGRGGCRLAVVFEGDILLVVVLLS